MPPDLHAAADAALTLALSRPPTLGAGYLICVDGPAGSGKTTLAGLIAEASRRQLPSVRVIHMDDLYEGWAGLGNVAERVHDGLIVPLAAGESGRYRRWDWLDGEWAEEHIVDPTSLLVIEGVGSGSLRYADAIGCLVWVAAPDALRLQRGLARDGEAMRAQWEQWMLEESVHFVSDRTRERADLLVEG